MGKAATDLKAERQSEKGAAAESGIGRVGPKEKEPRGRPIGQWPEEGSCSEQISEQSGRRAGWSEKRRVAAGKSERRPTGEAIESAAAPCDGRIRDDCGKPRLAENEQLAIGAGKEPNH